MKYGAVYSSRDTFTSPPCSIKALIAISKCRVRPNTEYNQLLHRESERWGKRERMSYDCWDLGDLFRVIRSCKFTVFVLGVIETKPRAACQSSILGAAGEHSSPDRNSPSAKGEGEHKLRMKRQKTGAGALSVFVYVSPRLSLSFSVCLHTRLSEDLETSMCPN